MTVKEQWEQYECAESYKDDPKIKELLRKVGNVTIPNAHEQFREHHHFAEKLSEHIGKATVNNYADMDKSDVRMIMFFNMIRQP